MAVHRSSDDGPVHGPGDERHLWLRNLGQGTYRVEVRAGDALRESVIAVREGQTTEATFAFR